MRRSILLLTISACLALPGHAQDDQTDSHQNHLPPRSERSREAGESSSRDSRIDLSPPPNDKKDHPNSSIPMEDPGDNTSSDVQEFHSFDPHRAAKDIEVGDFYFKKKNYAAALERYREALFYKPNDAFANFRMAQAFEKLAKPDDAAEHYEEYLRILPEGPLAAEARKALEKLKTKTPS